MKHRNFAAHCGNCPMWSHTKDEWGQCREEAPLAEIGEECVRNYAIWPETECGDWCAQHPDFWLEKHKEIEQDSLLSKKVFRIKGKSFCEGEELRVFWRPAFREKIYQGTLIDVLDTGEIPTPQRLLDCYRFDLADLGQRQLCFHLLGKPVKEAKVVLEKSNGHRVVIPFCGIERVEKWVSDEASDTPAMPEPDSRMSISMPKGTFAPDSKVTVNTLYGTCSFDWNFECIIANLSELVALRHEMQELDDLRERHDRLRAHLDGLAEKVRVMMPPLTMSDYYTAEMAIAWEEGRESVLALIEGDAT